MPHTTSYLPGTHSRAKYMRMDTARILKRFFFCEKALVIAQSGWLSSIAPIDVKINLPRFTWEDALTGHELRNRVFELRYPSRMMEVDTDAPVVDIFEQAVNAPSGTAFVLALARVFKPAQLAAYRAYMAMADVIADGPSVKFFRAAIAEKSEQIEYLETFAQGMIHSADEDEKSTAYEWVYTLQRALDAAGGLGLESPKPSDLTRVKALAQPFVFAEVPARDPQFNLVRYYWPNVVDETFPYGEGMMLQLRSAVSHLNEVWAIETGGAILYHFADKLDWEFTVDAARWTYDESRHTLMGYERLLKWGFTPEEMPLGTYIFDSARGEDPIVRLGMLHYFETKNIGKKTDRAEAFASYDDKLSQHDMEFDWADETIHAHYGAKWLKALQDKDASLPDRDSLHARCDALVNAVVAQATDADREKIFRVANAMIEKAALAAEVAE